MKNLYTGFGFVEYPINTLHCFIPGAPEAYMGTDQWDSRAEVEALARKTLTRWINICLKSGREMGASQGEQTRVEVPYPYSFEIKEVQGWEDGDNAFEVRETADGPTYVYAVVLHQEGSGDAVMAFVPGIPMCAAAGKDRGEALKSAAEAIRMFLDFSRMRLWPLYQTRVAFFSVDVTDEDSSKMEDNEDFFGNDFWLETDELIKVRASKLTGADLINLAVRSRFKLEIAGSSAVVLYDPEQGNMMLDVLIIPLLGERLAPMSLVHWVLRALLIMPEEVEDYLRIAPSVDTTKERISIRTTGAWVMHEDRLYRDVAIQWFLCGNEDIADWHPCFYRWITRFDYLDSDTRYRAIREYHQRYLSEEDAWKSFRHLASFNNGTLVRSTVSGCVGVEKLLSDKLAMNWRRSGLEEIGEIGFAEVVEGARLLGRYSVIDQTSFETPEVAQGITLYKGKRV